MKNTKYLEVTAYGKHFKNQNVGVFPRASLERIQIRKLSYRFFMKFFKRKVYLAYKKGGKV